MSALVAAALVSLSGCAAPAPAPQRVSLPAAYAYVVAEGCITSVASDMELTQGMTVTVDDRVRFSWELMLPPTDRQATALRLLNACAEAYPVDDRATRLRRAVDRSTLYDYSVGVLLPCLRQFELEGVGDVVDTIGLPTRVEFAAFQYRAWSPYYLLNPPTVQAAIAIAERCPSLPASLEGAPLGPRVQLG